MSILATASTTTPNIKIGDAYQATVDVTEVPEGAVLTYLWSNGATTKDISGVATAAGEINLSCDVTSTVDGVEPEKVTSNTVTITVTKKVMTVTAAVTPATQTILIKDSYTATCNVTGAPTGATITYAWSDGSTTQSTTKAVNTSGSVTLSCVVTVTHPDYETGTATSNNATVTVNKRTMTLTAAATPATQTVIIGNSYTASCAVTGAPSGATIAYLWTDGSTTQSTSKATSTLNPITLSCTATVTHPDYTTATKKSNDVTVTVSKKTMTLTATASTTTPSVTIGQTWNATVNVTGTNIPSDVAYTYLWSNGATTKDISGTAETEGTISLSCVVTGNGTNYNTATGTSNTLSIGVGKPVLTPTVSIDTTPPGVREIDNLSSIEISAVVTGIPEGIDARYIAYKWNSGETTSSITKIATSPGNMVVSCEVTISDPNYVEVTSNSNVLTIAVEKINIPYSDFEISLDKTPVKADEEYVASYSYTTTVENVVATQVWDNGDTTIDSSRVSHPGENILSVNVELSHPDFNTTILPPVSKLFFIPTDDYDRVFFHNLEPGRNAGFAWAGWWIIDEIIEAQKDGFDWKEDPFNERFKYGQALFDIADALKLWDDIEVQESRNGRILTKIYFD